MTRTLSILLASATLVRASAAPAADALKFAPPPSWVVPQSLSKTIKPSDAPVAMLLHDQQILLEPGKTTTYSEIALKIQNEQGLSAGNVSVAWQPSTDVMTVNKLQIRRGDQTIDVLAAGQTFTTMRREENLDLATLDGMLTANIQPEGLQQGDIIDFATTSEHVDPVMKGHVETNFATWNGAPIGLGHVRLIWPEGMALHMQQSAELPTARPVTRGGQSVLELSARDIEPILAPKDVPARFTLGRLAEASDFMSWDDAARLMLPLYRAAAVVPPTGPLRDEVETIRKATGDPKLRAEKALELVQNRVRYVALLMGQGGYVPANAETTWTRRFGDCKAKTALLMALLQELKIDAEPVLVNSVAGDAIASRLPMIGDFNHVLVRARIGGKTFWLDGTRTGDTSLERIPVPNFGWGLPLVATAKLVRIMPPPLDLPNSEIKVDVDSTAGVYAPAPVSIEETFRGDRAVAISQVNSQLSAAQRAEFLRSNAQEIFDRMSVATSSIQFDKATNELRIAIKGEAKLEWKESWHSVPVSSIAYNPDFERSPGPLHDSPLAVSYPEYNRRQIVYHLPPGFAPLQPKLPVPVKELLAGIEYSRSVAIAGDVATVSSSTRSIIPEIAFKDALAAEGRLKSLNDDDVYLRVPATYRPTSQDLATLVTEKPATADDYFVRAWAQVVHNKTDDAIGDLTAGLALEPKNVWALLKRASAFIEKQQLAKAELDLRAAEAISPNDSNVAAEWGSLAISKGDIASAVAAYDKALVRDPGNSWVRLKRAAALIQQDKVDDASREIGIVLAAEPRNAFALAQRAQIFASKRDWPAAEKDVAAALAADPSNTTALTAKATIAIERKDYKSAFEIVDETLRRDPNNSFARALRAQLLKREGNSAEAMRTFDEGVAQAPNDSSALLSRAISHIEAKDFDAAEKDIGAALAIEPSDPQALAARASLATARGDNAGAVTALTAALKTYPSNGPALAQRAEAYRQMRDYGSAFADTEAAIKVGFVPPSLRLLRINILLEQHDLNKTAAEADLLVKENPTSDFALVAAGKTYSALGMRHKAMESFDAALALRPYAYIYINRSQVRPFSDFKERLADLDAALRVEPDQEDALAEKARLLSRAGRHAEAISLYDRAIKTALDGSYLELPRAIALERAGRTADASKAFDSELRKAKTAADFVRICWTKATNDVVLQSALLDCRKAIRIDPGYPRATDSLGMALLKLGQLREALTTYNAAVAKKSGAEALMGRAIVYERMGDMTHAQADALEARKLRPDIDDMFAEYGLRFDDPGSTAKP